MNTFFKAYDIKTVQAVKMNIFSNACKIISVNIFGIFADGFQFFSNKNIFTKTC
jgi:hypothetical protein